MWWTFQKVKIPMKIKCLLAVAALCAMPFAAQAKPVQCFLSVNGKVYINKICDGSFDADGSFQLGTDNTPNGTGHRNKYFVYLNHNDDGTMEGNWNGIEAESHAHDPLGTLIQSGACWSNAQARVCAWKVGEKHN
jgi:hypothetical protein